MKRLSFQSLLLVLVLLGSQWLAIAHSAEHTAAQADDTLCVLCIQAHNLEQAQISHAPIISFEHLVPAPFEPGAVSRAQAHPGQANIRAPPHSVPI